MTCKNWFLLGCILISSNLYAKPIQNIQAFSNFLNVVFEGDKKDFLKGKDSMIGRMINTSNATNIISDYEANELRADKKYKGKHIRIKSVIASINNAIGNSAYVKINGKNAYESVLIYFDPKDERYLELSKGDKIDLICKGMGSSLTGDPMFADCLFPKEYADIVINLLKEDAINSAQQNTPPKTSIVASLVYGYNEKEDQADCKEANKNCLMVLKKMESRLRIEFTPEQKEKIKRLFDKYKLNMKNGFVDQFNRFNQTEKEKIINEAYQISPYFAFFIMVSYQGKELSFDELRY